MLANVTIVVKKGAHSLAGVALGLSPKGYRVKSQEISEAEPGLERIRLLLKCPDTNSDQLKEDFKGLEQDIRIEKIEFDNKPTATAAVAAADNTRTEKEILEDIVRAFPNVSTIVRLYGQTLSDETRSQTLYSLGTKIGRATYKKDFALGSPLKMPVAWRRMIVPAVRNFGETKADDESVTLLDCPFCSSGPNGVSCCQFVTGFVQGLLDAAPYTQGTRVHEEECRTKGAHGCTFVIDN